MAFLVSQAYDYNQFIRAVRSFVQGHPQIRKPTDPMLPFDGIVFSGTGAGELYVATNSGAVAGASPGTAYRLTCGVAGGAGVAKFTLRRDPTGANVLIGTVDGITADVRFRDATFGEVIIRTTSSWGVGAQINFSLVNSTLGAQAWSEDRFLEDLSADANGNYVTEWISHGPGVGGGLSIYTAMGVQYSHADDRYNIALYGQDSFAAGSAINLQPNSNSISGTVNVPLMCLRKSPMPFWLVCNGDRHAAIVKAGSVYEWYYQGFIAVHGTPGNHALPLFIGGCHTQTAAVTGSVDVPHRAFWDPSPHASTGSSAHFRWVDGTWIRTINNTDTTGSRTPAKTCVMLPYASYVSGAEAPLQSFSGFMARIKPALGTSEYEAIPITLAITSPQNAIVGDLIGVRAVSGFSQASENLLTIGGQTWVVGQNTFRTARDSFAALLLE